MIRLLVRVAWTNLRRDRAAQVLVFVLPVAFFSIFAVIFGGSDGEGGLGRLQVAVVDESHTATSTALVAALRSDSSLRIVTRAAVRRGAPAESLDRAGAEALVRSGRLSAAIVLPPGIDTSLARFDGRGTRAIVLVDPSDRVAAPMATGLLQRAALEATRSAANEFLGASAARPTPVDELMPARTEVRRVLGRREKHSMVAFYAAGIAVMFLMFSASGSAGGLIEETESGTLERVLSTGAGMTRLLAAKWVHVTTLCLAQLAVMFAWAAVVFRLELLPHLAGVVIVSVATAACTSAFGLVLATAARTRQQLAGLSNLVVLSLSAIGGSMFPRMFLPEYLQKASYVGFNAWALEAYVKVFWRDAPLAALWPQLAALAGFTALYLLLARRLARRWEAA